MSMFRIYIFIFLVFLSSELQAAKMYFKNNPNKIVSTFQVRQISAKQLNLIIS